MTGGSDSGTFSNLIKLLDVDELWRPRVNAELLERQ